MKKKIAYGVTGLILGCIFLFPIYILIMNSFKTTKGIFTDVLGFGFCRIGYVHGSYYYLLFV